MILPRLDTNEKITEEDGTPSLSYHKVWQTLTQILGEEYLVNTGGVTATSSTASHKLKITINGVDYYILLSTA